MPVSISEQSAFDAVAPAEWRLIWKKKKKKHLFITIFFFNPGGHKSEKSWLEICACANTGALEVQEWNHQSGSTPHTHPKKLLKASTTQGPSQRFLGCNKAKRRRRRQKKGALGKDGGLINIPVFVWFSPESQRPHWIGAEEAWPAEK